MNCKCRAPTKDCSYLESNFTNMSQLFLAFNGSLLNYKTDYKTMCMCVHMSQWRCYWVFPGSGSQTKFIIAFPQSNQRE